MKPRDAVISFQCLPPDLLQVVEIVGDEEIRHKQILRHPNVVTEMEKKYMFFAEQADAARRLIRRGRSCVFNVHFREL
jgi:hypothetical protein